MESSIAIRLKHFIAEMRLTNSQFADTCDIPRPTVSQILGGRNKKISDVLIGQIHEAFPKLSLYWLLFNEGEMLVSSDDESSENSEDLENTREGSDSQDILHLNAVNTDDDGRKHLQNNSVKPCNPTYAPPIEIEVPAVPPRKVSHITVYYDDSTFESFYPEDGRQK